MRDLMITTFYGGYSIPVGKKYINFPKVAPWMVIGLLASGIALAIPKYWILSLSLPILAIGFFAFMYQFYAKPLTKEEMKQYFPDSTL